MSEYIKLYVYENHEPSRIGKELLNTNNIKFKEVDIRKNGLMHRIYHDLDINKAPALVAPTGIFQGITGICKYIRSNGRK